MRRRKINRFIPRISKKDKLAAAAANAADPLKPSRRRKTQYQQDPDYQPDSQQKRLLQMSQSMINSNTQEVSLIQSLISKESAVLSQQQKKTMQKAVKEIRQQNNKIQKAVQQKNFQQLQNINQNRAQNGKQQIMKTLLNFRKRLGRQAQISKQTTRLMNFQLQNLQRMKNSWGQQDIPKFRNKTRNKQNYFQGQKLNKRFEQYQQQQEAPFNRGQYNRFALQFLPKRAPLFVRKYIDQRLEKYQSKKFNREQLQLIADKANSDWRQVYYNVQDAMADRQMFQGKIQQLGYTWDQQTDKWVYQVKNPVIKPLFSRGIMTKDFPTKSQLIKKHQQLQKDYINPSQLPEQLRQPVNIMTQQAAILGFSPHFGKISLTKQAAPKYYIGAFIDPVTGSVRLPPKPTTNFVNPFDQRSVAQYNILKAMYQWNSAMRQLQMLQKFSRITPKGWKTKVRQKRKNNNPLMRARNQYKNLITAILSKKQVYGINFQDQNYKRLRAVLKMQTSNQKQIIQAIQNFISYARDMAKSEVQRDIHQKRDIGLGDVLRFNSLKNWNLKPVITSIKFDQRTNQVPIMSKDTGIAIQQQDQIGNNLTIQQKQKLNNLFLDNRQIIFNDKVQIPRRRQYNRLDQLFINPYKQAMFPQTLRPKWDKNQQGVRYPQKRQQRIKRFLKNKTLVQTLYPKSKQRFKALRISQRQKGNRKRVNDLRKMRAVIKPRLSLQKDFRKQGAIQAQQQLKVLFQKLNVKPQVLQYINQFVNQNNKKALEKAVDILTQKINVQHNQDFRKILQDVLYGIQDMGKIQQLIQRQPKLKSKRLASQNALKFLLEVAQAQRKDLFPNQTLRLAARKAGYNIGPVSNRNQNYISKYSNLNTMLQDDQVQSQFQSMDQEQNRIQEGQRMREEEIE